MAILSEKWNGSIHRFGGAKVVALDILKAFDRVWHEALVTKLLASGVGSHFSKNALSGYRWRLFRRVQGKFRSTAALCSFSYSISYFLMIFYLLLRILFTLLRMTATFVIHIHRIGGRAFWSLG